MVTQNFAATLKSNISGMQDAAEETGFGGVKPLINKKKMSEKQKMALWQEFYNKTKLNRLEIYALEQ
jgi:hypothetical protein